jgi:hypothetical protein
VAGSHLEQAVGDEVLKLSAGGDGAAAGSLLEGRDQHLAISAGKDDVEVAVARTGQDEEFAGGLEVGSEARYVTAAQAGFAGQGLEAGPGKATVVGVIGDSEEQ